MAADLPFCPGLAGRELCKSCSGRIPEEQRGNVRVMHNPWPFDPCPHYAPAEAGEQPAPTAPYGIPGQPAATAGVSGRDGQTFSQEPPMAAGEPEAPHG